MNNITSDLELKKDGRLPQGWVWAKLGQLTKPSNEKVDPNEIEETVYIGLEHIDKDTGNLLEHGTSSEVRSTKSVFHSGDILYGKLRPYLNKVCLIDFDGVCSTDILVFPKSPHISNKFLAYRMLANDFVAYASRNVSGVQHPRVHFRTLAEFPIALPPLSEQERIVDKIDELLTRLDAGIGELIRVQANLARYKASVLKAACEGRLVPTEAELARAEGRDYESGEELLQRILAERKQIWVEEQRDKDKDPSKMKYREPEPPDTEHMPELPEGWVWATWNQLSPRVTVGHVGKMKDQYIKSGIPFLRSQNVRENRFDPEGLVHISKDFHKKLSKSALKPGDLVVVRSGSVGVTCVIPPALDEANCSDLVIIKKSLGLVSEYGSYYMNSLAKRHVKEGQVGIALTHFNTKSVANLPVPLPPLTEQERTADEVERKLSVLDEIQATIDLNLARTNRLRQVVLWHAFEGKLVPQNLEDEPALILPHSIKSNRHDGKQLDMFSE